MFELEVWQAPITDNQGSILPGAQITVFNSDDTVATIYDDLDRAPKANPFNVGTDALARFYAEPGRYRVQAQSGTDIAVYDNVDLSQKALRSDLAAPDSEALISGIQAKEFTRLNELPIAGTFETGFTITDKGQFAIFKGAEAGGSYIFRWDGALPKDVPANSSPDTTGGVDVGAWVDVGQAALRSELAAPLGSARIGNNVVTLSSIKELADIPAEQLRTDLQYSAASFWPDLNLGGATRVWNPDRPKADHDGATVVDPDKLSELGLPSDVDPFGTYFTANTDGFGCFERLQNDGKILASHYGCVGNNTLDNTTPLNHALQACPEPQLFLAEGDYRVTDTINMGRVSLRGDYEYSVNNRPAIRMDSETPKIVVNMGTDGRNLEGVAIFGDTNNRIHTGVFGRLYRGTLKNLQVQWMDIGFDIAGVYVWSEKHNVNACRIGFYYSNLERSAGSIFSTMYSFKECVYMFCEYGILIENRYGGSGNNENLVNLFMENCGFEQSDYGISATEHVWNWNLIGCWFEACSQFGLHSTNTNTDIAEILCRHEPNAPRSVATRKGIRVRGASVDVNQIRPGSIRPYEDVDHGLDYIPDGQVIARIQPITNPSAGSREVVHVGNSNYALGPTETMLALTPSRGDPNGGVGGFIKGYSAANTSGGNYCTEIGVLLRSGVSEERERIGLTVDRNANVGVKADGARSFDYTLTVNGIAAPMQDNQYALGASASRWSEVYAANGTINTSDAREKTSVREMTENEIQAAKELAKEIGVYQWLNSISEKGDAARQHIGMTVQKAISIMENNGLEPMSYGFICYDEWEDVWQDEYEDIERESEQEVELEDGTKEIQLMPYYESVPTGNKIKVKEAGNTYSFRYDQLTLFIARGFEARLSDLED